MSIEEIKKAIYQLNQDERRELIDALTPQFIRATPEQLKRNQEIFDKNNAEDKWVSWEDLRTELGR